MNNLVSIIVAVWNVVPYLRRSLDSILSQTYPYLEVILVDDGSPDNSGKICDEYAAKDERIKVIHQKNQGVSVARQVGLDAATGDYVIHFDPDDYAESDMIECLVSEAERSKADMVTCNYFTVDGWVKRCQHHGHDDLLQKMFYKKVVISLWNTLIRHKFIIENHVAFYPSWLSHSEDMLFLFRCVCAGAVAVYLDKAFYHYIIRGDSLVTTHSKNSFHSNVTLIEELEKMVNAKDYDDLFQFKRYTLIYAYESRYWKEMKGLFPDIRHRLIGEGNSDRYSIESQLARCMKYPPCLVWIEAKIHKYAMLFVGKIVHHHEHN